MLFTLSEQEATLVLQSLAKQPFEVVFQLIANFQTQANDQMTKKDDSDGTES
jgi:hypothetical protein